MVHLYFLFYYFIILSFFLLLCQFSFPFSFYFCIVFCFPFYYLIISRLYHYSYLFFRSSLGLVPWLKRQMTTKHCDSCYRDVKEWRFFNPSKRWPRNLQTVFVTPPAPTLRYPAPFKGSVPPLKRHCPTCKLLFNRLCVLPTFAAVRVKT